jgi:hypothetical protein
LIRGHELASIAPTGQRSLEELEAAKVTTFLVESFKLGHLLTDIVADT